MKKQTNTETRGETTQSPKVEGKTTYSTIQKPDLDVGFRVLKESDAPIDEHDWFFEALTRAGMPLSVQIQTYSVDGCQIWVGEDDATKEKIVACFDKELPDSVFLKIAAGAPKKAVFFEDAVPSKEAGLKVYKWFKKLSPETEILVLAPTERPEKKPLNWLDPFLRQVGGDHFMKMRYQPMDFFIKYGLRSEFGLAAMSYLKYLQTGAPEELDKLKQYIDFIDAAMNLKYRQIDMFVEQFENEYVRDTMIHILLGNTDEVRRRIEEMKNGGQKTNEEPQTEGDDNDTTE